MTSEHATPGHAESFELVSSTSKLSDLCDRLSGQSFVALDTEFMREKTYYPELCLVQLASEHEVACVDVRSDLELTPLWKLLADRSVIKVFHAARQDNEIFLNVAGIVPGPVFDTQIAAALTGIGDQMGYAAMIKALLGREIDKSQSRTDWLRRPLSEAQLHYAADDVRYLVDAYLDLVVRLRVLERLEWAREDSATLETPGLYRVDPDDAWQRIRGARRLRGKERDRIRALAKWREREAVERNRPRRWIVRDDALLELARRAPEHRDHIAAIDAVPESVTRRYADTLLELVREPAPAPEPDREPIDPRDPERLRRINKLISVTEALATELDIPRSALASRSELESIADGEQSTRVLDGWRRDIIGTRLLEALDDSGASDLA